MDCRLLQHLGRDGPWIGMIDRHSTTSEVPFDVQEHPTADDAVLGEALDAQQGIAGDQPLWICMVVEAVVRVPEVAEAVDLTGGLRKKVVDPVVAVEFVQAEDAVLQGAAVRNQGPGKGVQGKIQ